MISYYDVECPSCKKGIHIKPDNCHDYEDNELYSQICNHCDKTFSFTVEVCFSYHAYKADCLNDGEHQWKETNTFPKEFTRLECRNCGERKNLSKERMAEITKDM